MGRPRPIRLLRIDEAPCLVQLQAPTGKVAQGLIAVLGRPCTSVPQEVEDRRPVGVRDPRRRTEAHTLHETKNNKSLLAGR